MSIAAVDNLSNRAGTKPPAVTRGEFVQARAKYSGSTPAITDSFNVSSLTDNAAGDQTLNWSTAFGNVDYTATTDAIAGTGSATKAYPQSLNNASSLGSAAASVSSLRIATTISGNLSDVGNVFALAVGDYA
ncbi:hypothetical protein [Tepidimonas sp.]|uniref:hypothetical protein n=1 Tax=Tepidimonas sp. TaxID=2002775 RepID=UPI00391A7AE9